MIKVTREIQDGNDLRREFQDMNRGNSFSEEGFDALFQLINDISPEDFELDVIALDCDFAEDSLENVLKNYNLESFEELSDNTLAVMLDSGDVLYQSY
jgi:hypothetical protein